MSCYLFQNPNRESALAGGSITFHFVVAMAQWQHCATLGRAPGLTVCHTPDVESCIVVQGGSAYHSATYSNFQCSFHHVYSIYVCYNCICTSHLRSQLCLNRHRTTGNNVYCSCISHQATLSAAALCVV